jgi:REP element-mobilizing transposase RayT
MILYRRHLPHQYQIGQPVFVTWRLYGSLPPSRAFPPATLTSGQAFDALDRLLDGTQTGPLYLRQEPIAGMIVEAIRFSESTLRRYSLHAFVVMANHVHVLISPHVALPALMKSLKSFTAKRANQMLARTGSPFWQEESYDHCVRNEREFERIRAYVEDNPVRAGMVREATEFRWSSAWRPSWSSAADQEVRPTQ